MVIVNRHQFRLCRKEGGFFNAGWYKFHSMISSKKSMERMLIETTLEALKDRLSRNNQLIEIYSGEGRTSQVQCSFNAPATNGEIETFETQTGLLLPEDYKKFLLLNNGARLFNHPYYGGEIDLYDIELVTDICLDGDLKEGWYQVAYHYGQEVVIDSNRVRDGRKDYLLWRDACAPWNEGYDLGMNFEIWLDRLIICQGVNFWQWNHFDINSNSRNG